MAKASLPDDPKPYLIAPPIVGGAVRGALTLQPGSICTDNEHGIDTLQRTFFGMADDVYRLAPKRGDKDKWLPSMLATDRSFAEGRGLTATVTVTYRGLLDDKVPDVVIKGGWSEQTAQLSVSYNQGGPGLGLLIGNGTGDATNTDSLPDNADQLSEVNITYRAPRTTFLYVQRKRPTGPKYDGQLMTSVADFSIIEMRPARITGRPMAIFDVRCASFDVERAGSYWACTEVQQTFLIPRDASLLRYKNRIVNPFPVVQLRVR